MGNTLINAIEGTIVKLVGDFQGNPGRFWNERDMHWSLFYYLEQEGVIQETYVTQLIRAEFPTFKKFGEQRPARGHYDLAVLDLQSYNSEAAQTMEARASWDWGDYLKLVKVMIAVEIKLWLSRLPFERAGWDIQKLTESPNNVRNAYFLNFVQLDFNRPHSQRYYERLRGYLMSHKSKWPDLKILCVPSDRRVQPDPGENWLSLP
jgi:hypothetical protein